MNNKINEILNEIKKVIIGKDDKIARVLMALLAEGHILIEDVPGVGKTTLALEMCIRDRYNPFWRITDSAAESKRQ